MLKPTSRRGQLYCPTRKPEEWKSGSLTHQWPTHTSRTFRRIPGQEWLSQSTGHHHATCALCTTWPSNVAPLYTNNWYAQFSLSVPLLFASLVFVLCFSIYPGKIIIFYTLINTIYKLNPQTQIYYISLPYKSKIQTLTPVYYPCMDQKSIIIFFIFKFKT